MMKPVHIFILASTILLVIALIPLFIIYLVLKTIGSLIVMIAHIGVSLLKTLTTKSQYSELNLRRHSGMVAREILDEYLRDKYKGEIITLYINSKKREYTAGTLEDNDINNELVETLHLAIGLGSDFVVAIFPNTIDSSLDLIQSMKDIKSEGENIMLTIPTFKSTEETGGGILVVIFSTLFSGALLLVYDHIKIKDSFMIETENGIRITH